MHDEEAYWKEEYAQAYQFDKTCKKMLKELHKPLPKGNNGQGVSRRWGLKWKKSEGDGVFFAA